MIKLLALLLGGVLLPHLAAAGTITCPAGSPSNCALSIQGVQVAPQMPTDTQVMAYSLAAGAWLPSTLTASVSGITVGTTTVGGCGTNGFVLFNNAGVLGCEAGGGGGSVSITAGNAGIVFSPSPLTGTGTASLNITGGGAVAHEWLSALSGAGAATLSQPNFTDLAGSAAAAQMATNLGAAVSTLCSASTTNFVRGDGTCVAPSGGSTTITLAPGLATTPGTYNAGAQTAVNGSTLSPQLFYKAETASCTINSTCNSPSTADGGLLPTFTNASLTGTLPNPGTVGGPVYQFGYDGTHSYSVTTVGGTATIYGCGASGTTVAGLSYATQFVTDGTNYQCIASIGGNFTTFQATTNTLTISGSTFTPVLTAGVNQQMTLATSSCSCTIANPTGIASAVGQTGMLDIIQPATGGPATITTWGSQYITPGGTSTLTLSTGANAVDHIAYRVIDSTHVLLAGVQQNATH